MIPFAYLGAVTWFIFNIWLTVAAAMIVTYGGLDCSGLFSRYATRAQRIVGLIWCTVVAVAWGSWIYLIRTL